MLIKQSEQLTSYLELINVSCYLLVLLLWLCSPVASGEMEGIGGGWVGGHRRETPQMAAADSIINLLPVAKP